MSKSKKNKTPRIDPRTLLRPRLDALLDRRARGEVDGRVGAGAGPRGVLQTVDAPVPHPDVPRAQAEVAHRAPAAPQVLPGGPGSAGPGQ